MHFSLTHSLPHPLTYTHPTNPTTLAPLSFLADYVYMDQDSIFHVVDRMIAIPLMTLELWKVGCLWRWRYWERKSSCCAVSKTCGMNTTMNGTYIDYYHSTTIVVLYTLGTIMAIACFLLSQQSQSEQDLNGFILWHNRWHL